MGTVSPVTGAEGLTNRRIAAMLFNIATLLDLAQDNLYRVRAYRRAARRILALPEPATAIVARGEELPLPGVGTRIRRKLAELIGSGGMRFYEELLEDQPQHIQALMALEGMGPKLALRLYDGLGVASPQQLIAAAERGTLQSVFGFGPQREAAFVAAARRQIAATAPSAHVA